MKAKKKRLSKRGRDIIAAMGLPLSPSTAPLAASDAAAAELLHVARVTFIRDTAQLLFIRSRDPYMADPKRKPMTADECWLAARVLWTAKPRDC